MSMYVLPDAALPPEIAAISFLEEHLALILGVVAGVVAVTILLIVLLKMRKKK